MELLLLFIEFKSNIMFKALCHTKEKCITADPQPNQPSLAGIKSHKNVSVKPIIYAHTLITDTEFLKSLNRSQ